MAKPSKAEKAQPKKFQDDDYEDGYVESDKKVSVKEQTVHKRIYRGKQELDHDLYKLMPAIGQKNVSYTNTAKIQRYEHSHFFHTIDSNGKTLATCNAMGGHHHEVTVIPGKGDAPPTLKVSGPLRYARQRVPGKARPALISVPVDLGNGEVDDHTHDVQYLGSEKIMPRTLNTEAAKLQGAITERQNPQVDGVYEK